MSRKSKGIAAERELIHNFWERGWAAIRVAGSGSIKYPCPDLLVGNGVRRLAIECKTTKTTKKYFTKEKITELKQFSIVFGAEPWIAIKFTGLGWFFISTNNLKEKNKSFMVSIKIIRKKGLQLNELIK